ncbi:beta-1,3-galactosyltransferase 1-like [Antedon mediterranea]|uniref:beta-1,3-galactosyltransferase 1-like n=1 Tax=Antedon mediterranea TaxID=105859 RepID=UPI003AF4FCFD
MDLYRNLLLIAIVAFANFLFYFYVMMFMATEKAEMKKLLQLQYRNLPPNKELPTDDVLIPMEASKTTEQAFNVDPRSNYSFSLNNDQACKTNNTVFLLVVVFSTHEHFENRRLIRKSWGSVNVVNDRNIVTIFLLGRVHDHDLQYEVEEENKEYNDIIIGDFDDTYKNLTLKTIQTLKWSTQFCPDANYVMKTDDDMFVHYLNIVQFLAGKTKKKNFAVGCYMKTKPIRNVRSKWYMPKQIFSKNIYPPFLSGTGYIMSRDLVSRMYKVSSEISYLHLEDVFAGTIWEKLGVKPEGNSKFHNYQVKYSHCAYQKLFTSHTSPNFVHIWTEMKVKRKESCK